MSFRVNLPRSSSLKTRNLFENENLKSVLEFFKIKAHGLWSDPRRNRRHRLPRRT